MKRLLVLTVLAAATTTSFGCCSCGLGRLGGCGRRDACGPYEAPCDSCGEQPCDSCGGGPAMMTAPAPAPIVTPGPATYSSSYLPR